MSALEQGKNILIQCDGHSLKTVTDHILRTGERERGAHFDSEATTREGERGGERIVQNNSKLFF